MNKEAQERIAACKQTKATSLDLRRLNLTEIPAEINDLVWLEKLMLYENQISEIKGLEKLTNLKELNLASNQISEIKGLDKLTDLKELSLYSNQISEIKGLDKLTDLTVLNLASNQISEIKGLDKLTDLTVLNLASNQISQIKSLDKLTDLTALSLSSNQISEIKGLDKLTALTQLNLDSNQISQIEGLKKLNSLTALYLDSNQISEIKGLDKKTGLRVLSLSSNQISEIKGLDKLTDLVGLYLASNQISKIKGLDKLIDLFFLRLDSNQISKIKGLEKLTGLTELWLDSNQISELKHLNQLQQLEKLNLQNNKIDNLLNAKTLLTEHKLELAWEKDFYAFKDKGINLYGNPLTNPPADVVQQGKAAVLQHFEQLAKEGGDYLYEARLLIVGQGGAGKTCLKRKLLDEDNPMTVSGDTTRGIEIDTLAFKTAAGKNFDLRIWDFGGQNIQHYAHQFFLSDSSLYALVHNEREQNTNFTYWLNIIEMLGKESPVVIVQNEIEGHSEPLKNIAAIRDRYPNVESMDKGKATHQVNIKTAKTDKRFAALKAHLQKIASDPEKLPHLKNQRPASFIKVRNQIEELVKKQQYFISWKAYVDLCNEAGANDVKLQKDYSKTMTKLGICLHFPALKDYVFLNPKWIIDALFLLLYNPTVIKQKGKFCE